MGDFFSSSMGDSSSTRDANFGLSSLQLLVELPALPMEFTLTRCNLIQW